MRAAAIQMTSGPNRALNLKAAEHLISEAAGTGATVVALPENFSYLGRAEDKPEHGEDPRTSPTLEFLREQARSHDIYVVGGTIPLRTSDPSRVSNSCFVLAPDGAVLARYDKIHLFDVEIDAEDTHRESDHVVAGSKIVTCDLGGVIGGLSVCYDVRFPELYRRLAFEGAQVMFVPAAFTVPTGKAHWEVLLRARAVENQCYVVAPAQVGTHVEGRTTYGHSMIVNPWGDVVAEASEGQSVISADLDMAFRTDLMRRLPVLDSRRDDVFPG